ncbi:MAG: Hsp33 family molecular chaperone HslO [Oscillospiraceae bacterium]
MSKLIRAISKNGGVIICVVDSSDIVSKMEEYHKTSATASAALGRLLTAASLMGSMLKEDDCGISLKINANGAIGSMYAVSDSVGNVRGYCDNPLADMPLNPANQKLNVGGIVGTQGALTVTRDFGTRASYSGETKLVSGEIAEDIAAYYAKSEQIPTACALGVLVNTDLTIRVAGGYLLQLLPGASDEEIALIEKNIKCARSVTEMLNDNKSVYDIISVILRGFDPEVLSESQVEYKCNCSEEKMAKALISIGRDEIARLADEQDETEVVCSYCNKRFIYKREELLQLFG